MELFGAFSEKHGSISQDTPGIYKGPWFEKEEDARPAEGQVIVRIELEQGWADWVATRLASGESTPSSEVKLFPGARFAVVPL